MTQEALFIGGPLDGQWAFLEHDRDFHVHPSGPILPPNVKPMDIDPVQLKFREHHYRRHMLMEYSGIPNRPPPLYSVFYHESILEGREMSTLLDGYRRPRIL
jgi:hypothetical protein